MEQGTTCSILNHNLFYQDRALVKEDAGRNYGIDLTLERYLNDGLYGMLTATLFRSEYRDAQGELRTTVGYALSVKYTINKRRTSNHFILEYLQMKTFQGQTFDIHTHEIVDKFTSLTFPNIAYRVEFCVTERQPDAFS